MEGLRFHIRVIQFYRRNEFMSGRDPAAVVRDAVARALVHYYPWSLLAKFRLRELEDRKLAVDCTGEGVLFTEADADVRLEHLGNALQPPFKSLEELLLDVPGSSEVLGTPLLLFQVTRLSCGGFILAVRHDGGRAGAGAVPGRRGGAGAGRRPYCRCGGASYWRRGTRRVLASRTGSTTRCRTPREPSCRSTTWRTAPSSSGPRRSPPSDISHLAPGLRPEARHHVRDPHGLPMEVPLAPDADEEMRMICTVNARGGRGKGKGKESAIPTGYYGNAFAFPVAVSAAGELCARPLSYAVQLVKEAKGEVDGEYIRSVADLMAGAARAAAIHVGARVPAGVGRDQGRLRRPGLRGGPAKGAIPGVASFLIPFKNAKGEDGIVIPMCLPGPAMDGQRINILAIP
ncbi:hypothetical protein ACQ4PT_062358 [Festuca glaucescens]